MTQPSADIEALCREFIDFESSVHDVAFAEKAKKLAQAYLDQAARISSLFDKIKHGDQAHQDWLKAAIEEHFK